MTVADLQGIQTSPAIKLVTHHSFIGNHQRIVTVTAEQRINAGSRDQPVVPGIAAEFIVARSTNQNIVSGVSNQTVISAGTCKTNVRRIRSKRGDARLGD